MKHLLAIIGQPGAGKTTALRLALRGVPCHPVVGCPPFIAYPSGVQLGVDRPGGFSGSDGYSLSVQPLVIAWLRDAPFCYVLTEGDRLSNDGIFQAALSFGYDLQIAWIDTPDDIAAARRLLRGSLQDPAWVRGRQTKVSRLVERWSARVTRIDGRGEAEEIANRLSTTKVIKRLREDAR